MRRNICRDAAKIRAWQNRDFIIGVKKHDERKDELIEVARRLDAGDIPDRAIERRYFDDVKTFLCSLRVRNKYESDLAESLHEAMADMYEIGLIDDDTMQEFDENCLTDTWRRWNGKRDSWAVFFAKPSTVPDDFLSERKDTPPEPREIF